MTATDTKRTGVTGRDGYILMKAVAYAIETIDRLPRRWQEGSDCEDMKKLLAAMTKQGDYYRLEARSHILRVGLALKDGQLVLKNPEALPPETREAKAALWAWLQSQLDAGAHPQALARALWEAEADMGAEVDTAEEIEGKESL